MFRTGDFEKRAMLLTKFDFQILAPASPTEDMMASKRKTLRRERSGRRRTKDKERTRKRGREEKRERGKWVEEDDERERQGQDSTVRTRREEKEGMVRDSEEMKDREKVKATGEEKKKTRRGTNVANGLRARMRRN